MASLKERLDDTLKRFTNNVNNALNNDELTKEQQMQKAKNEARAGLIYSIVYQKLIDEFGAEADPNKYTKKFTEVDQKVRKDELLMSEIENHVEKGSPQDILKLAENPAEYLKSVEEKRPAFEESKAVRSYLDLLAFNNNYKQMTEYCLEQCSNPEDPLYQAKVDGISSFFRNLTAVPKDPKLQEENSGLLEDNLQVFQGFAKEFSRLNAEAAVDGIQFGRKIEQKIRNEGFTETALITEDEKLPRKLGNQIVLNQTGNGRKLRLFDSVFRAISSGVAQQNEQYDTVSVGEERADKFLANTRLAAAEQSYRKEFPEAGEQLDNQNRTMQNEDLLDMLNPPAADQNIDGYVIKSKPVKKNESLFAAVNQEHQQIMRMSEDALLLAEQLEKDKLQKSVDARKTLAGLAPLGKKLADEMDAMGDAFKDSPEHRNLRAELNNFQNFGKIGFKYKGSAQNPQEGAYIQEDPLNPNTAKIALNRLNQAANEYAKKNPAFAGKVNRFVWEQQQNYRSELSANATTEKLKLLQKSKQLKNLENETLSPEKDYLHNMNQAFDHFAEAKKKYDDGKLRFHRGSPEYKQIDGVLTELGKRMKELTEAEDLLGKQRLNDEERQRILKSKAEAVQEQIKVLKEKNREYYAHKLKDGQWKKGTNQRADQRIEAVQGLDDFANSLEATISKKINMTEKIIRKELETRDPDYDIWVELYPKSVSKYEAANEHVPDGMQKFESSVNDMREFHSCVNQLGEQMKKLGYSKDFEAISEITSKMDNCLCDKSLLDEKNITKEQWNETMVDNRTKLRECFANNGVYHHLMEAADAYDKQMGTLTHETLVSSLNTMNKVLKSTVPVKRLEEEYKFYSEKKRFAEMAADIYARHEYDRQIEEYLKKNSQYSPAEVQSVREQNTWQEYGQTEKGRAFRENLRNSDRFQGFMNSITNAESLEAMQIKGGANNGVSLYQYISEGSVDLTKQLEDAQNRLKTEQQALGEGVYPDKEQFRNDYATIMTVLKIQDNAEKQGVDISTLTANDFESAKQAMLRRKDFNEMMNSVSGGTLFEKATAGNGREMNILAQKAKDRLQDKKNAQELREQRRRQKMEQLNKAVKGIEFNS